MHFLTGRLWLQTTLEMLVPGVKAQNMTVHSPAPEAESGGSFSNEPAGARLTLPTPAVYFVVELSY